MQLINIVDNKISNNTCSSPNIKKTIIAKGDSAATAHYFRLQDADVLENKTNIKEPTIKQPDNTDLTSEGSGTIPLSKHLSAEAQTAMIIPNLKSASLISIGQLCDDGCTAVMDKKDLAVVKKNTVILRGKRNKMDGLWDIPIENNHIKKIIFNYQQRTRHYMQPSNNDTQSQKYNKDNNFNRCTHKTTKKTTRISITSHITNAKTLLIVKCTKMK